MSEIVKSIQSKTKTSLYIADYSSEGKEQYYRLVFDMDLKSNWVYKYLMESCIKRAHEEGRFTIGWLEDFFVALEFEYELEWHQAGNDEISKDFFNIEDDITIDLYAPVTPSDRQVRMTMKDLNGFDKKLDNIVATLEEMSKDE